MTKTNKEHEVDFNEVRSKVRNEIVDRYGSVSDFLKHKDARKFGGEKIRCYLYDSGAKNFNIIARLCEYLGMGQLKREIKVVRTAVYTFSPNEDD